jgi:two-component system sensor kinase FixL
MKPAVLQMPLPPVEALRSNKLRARLTSPVTAAFLVSVAYYLGAKLGFALTLQPQPVSILWPPNSILLAALLLTPPRWWWFLFLAVIPAHWASQLQSDVPQMMILCWFISNCCEALIGAACVRWLSGAKPRLNTFRDMGVFIACGVFLSPFLSSFLDAGFVSLNRWGESSYWAVWQTRFFSNALAALTLVTVILSWSGVLTRGVRRPARRVIPEAALLAVGLVLVSFIVFVGEEPGVQTRGALLYLPLPFLLWAAVRFGVSGASASLLVVTLISIWGTAHGWGPFASRSPLENARSLQIFLLVICVTQLCLAAALEERGKAEEALRTSEERYREVIETQTDLICRFLPDTTLTFVNEAYCRFFKRQREQLIGRKFIELIPEPDREKTLERIATLSEARGVQTIEHQVLLPNGRLGWHHWVNHAICGTDGRVVEMQAIGHDISDRKQAEEANERLAHVSRLAMVGELTASIAHEINQPLGAILSNAEAASMLLDATPRNIEEIKQILADIRKDDVRASDVIRHIRTLLRKRHLEMELLDMNQLVSDVLALTRAETRKRNIAWKSEFAPAMPMVEGDRVHLQQVLLNLVLNGMDAMADTPEDERWLTVSTAGSESGQVEIAVSDSGSGIRPDRLPRLFESFFTTKKEGMGLGLSISRMIVEAHRGQIRAENNSGRGATFRVVLPAHQNLASGA